MSGMRAEKIEAKHNQSWVWTEIMTALRKGDNEELQKLSMTFIETKEKTKQKIKKTNNTKFEFNKLKKKNNKNKKREKYDSLFLCQYETEKY